MITLILFCAVYLSYAIIVHCISKFAMVSATDQSPNKAEFEISVIIPFRNEINRIKPLLESINALSTTATLFIFVDDNSTDATKERIESVLKIKNYVILESKKNGKKEAIRLAVSYAKTEYCITWDADIIVRKNYFQAVKNYDLGDLAILPVEMMGQTSLQKFASLDYLISQVMNVASSINRPILASGANLIFRRTVFEQLKHLEKHQIVASGDDLFLLKNFRANKCSIRMILDQQLIVKTTAPSSMKEFLQQRLRWIGKTSKVNDNFANSVGILNIVFLLFFWFCLVYNLYNYYFWSSMIFMMIRYLADMLILYPLLIFYNRLKLNYFLIFAELIYPFYVLALLFGSLFFKLYWKDRSI